MDRLWQEASDAERRCDSAAFARAKAALLRAVSPATSYSGGPEYIAKVKQWTMHCPTFAGYTLAALTFGGPTLYVQVELGGSSTTTSPQLFEPFSIASSGFVGGGSLGAELPIIPGLSVGVRGSFLGFSNSGSAVFHPTDERFTAGINSMETVDVTARLFVSFVTNTKANLPEPGQPVNLQFAAFAGGAWGQTAISSPVASVDQTLSGSSWGVGVQVPAVLFIPQFGPGPMIGVQYRHYEVSGNVALFGPGSDPIHVNQRGDIITGTLSVPISPGAESILVIDEPSRRGR